MPTALTLIMVIISTFFFFLKKKRFSVSGHNWILNIIYVFKNSYCEKWTLDIIIQIHKSFMTLSTMFMFRDTFFFFFFISWRLITLQYCSGFYYTLTWISHGFTFIPHPDPHPYLPLHPIPLGLPSAFTVISLVIMWLLQFQTLF